MPVENRGSVHEFHTTLLHLLGPLCRKFWPERITR
jgi:hypothetical protein